MPPNTVEITVQAKTDLKKAHDEVKGFGSAVHSAMSVAEGVGLEKLFEKGIEGAKEAILEYAKYGEEVRKIQKLTGESAEDASRLLHATHELGIEFDTVARGMGIFSKNMLVVAEGEAGFTDGINTTKKVLESLGIQVTDTSGAIRPMKDLLLDLSAVFEKMPDGPTKTGLAMQLFGRGGTAMLPLLNQGAKGIEELNAAADKLGLTLSQKDVDAAHEFTMANREMNAAIKGMEISVGRELLPSLTLLAQAFTKGLESGENFTKFMKGAAFMLGAIWMDAMTLISNAIMSAFEAAINFIIHQINSLGDKIKVPDFVPGVGGNRVIPKIEDASLGRSDLADPMEGFRKLFPELGHNIKDVNDETKKTNPTLKDFSQEQKDLAKRVKESAEFLKLLEKGEVSLDAARKAGLITTSKYYGPGGTQEGAKQAGALEGYAAVKKAIEDTNEANFEYVKTLSKVAEMLKENVDVGKDYILGLENETKAKLDAAAAELFGKGTKEQVALQLQIDTLAKAILDREVKGHTRDNDPQIRYMEAQQKALELLLRQQQAGSKVREDTIKYHDRTIPSDAEQEKKAKELTKMMAITTEDIRDLSRATKKDMVPAMDAARGAFNLSRDAARELGDLAFRGVLIPKSYDVAAAYDGIVAAANTDVDAINAHALAARAAADKLNEIASMPTPTPGPAPSIGSPDSGGPPPPGNPVAHAMHRMGM